MPRTVTANILSSHRAADSAVADAGTTECWTRRLKPIAYFRHRLGAANIGPVMKCPESTGFAAGWCANSDTLSMDSCCRAASGCNRGCGQSRSRATTIMIALVAASICGGQYRELEMPDINVLPKAIATTRIDQPHVRVIEYRFAPGAETGWHRHGHDYVVVPWRQAAAGTPGWDIAGGRAAHSPAL